MNQKLYNNKIMMKPKVTLIHMLSGTNTKVVTFDFKEMILNMVSNKSLFHPNNLLLDPNNPCSSPPESQFYGDVNTEAWHVSAKQKECTLPNHILVPFCHFIDGLSVDKYGKLTVEAVLI